MKSKDTGLSPRRRAYDTAMRLLMKLAALFTGGLLLFLVGYVLWRGLPNLSWQLVSTKPSYLSENIGILPDILNTVYIVIATLAVVLPLGVGAAVYLTEYASNRRLASLIEYAAETLSGIPSIIYGLVGMLFFCQFLNFKTSLLAGALTLVIMNLPTVLRTTQESLKTVPQSYREGAFGLGGANGGSSAPWCCRAAWTASSPDASFRWGVFWANRPPCCSPPGLPTPSTALPRAWAAPAPPSPWPCTFTPKSRVNSAWPSPSPSFC